MRDTAAAVLEAKLGGATRFGAPAPTSSISRFRIPARLARVLLEDLHGYCDCP